MICENKDFIIIIKMIHDRKPMNLRDEGERERGREREGEGERGRERESSSSYQSNSLR